MPRSRLNACHAAGGLLGQWRRLNACHAAGGLLGQWRRLNACHGQRRTAGQHQAAPQVAPQAAAGSGAHPPTW